MPARIGLCATNKARPPPTSPRPRRCASASRPEGDGSAAPYSLPFVGDGFARPKTHTDRQTYLIARYSSMPYLDPSRPKPEVFTPPNGASAVEMRPVLTP